MQGENIICFSKDWCEQPTSNHHVMVELAKHNRVLWLNSVSTRTPKLSSVRDRKKIVKKVAEFFRGPKKKEPDLWVFTPLVLPFPHSAAARRVNQELMKATLWALRKRLDMPEFQLWTFLPNVVDYVGASGESLLGESLLVYYCVDEWSMFSYIDAERMVAAEKRLCAKADIIFAVCDGLVENKRLLNEATFLATHGVDHALFARALHADTPIPDDVARLNGPVLGFYGTIQDWVDQKLLAGLAERHPDWNIVIIGTELCDTTLLRKFKNVHFLGRREHQQLPAYCKRFDVALIPYVVNERMRYVNPIKLREYLSAGLAVISTPLPEVSRYDQHCHVADGLHAFEEAVRQYLDTDTPAARQARSDAMATETWAHKVMRVAERIGQHKKKQVQ